MRLPGPEARAPKCGTAAANNCQFLRDEACTVTLSRKPPSEALQREYQALSLRLEYELLRHLQEVNGEPGVGRGSKGH